MMKMTAPEPANKNASPDSAARQIAENGLRLTVWLAQKDMPLAAPGTRFSTHVLMTGGTAA